MTSPAERDALVKALRADMTDPRVPVETRRHCVQAIVALTAHPSAGEPVSADHVICPACCNQFRAIPVNVQKLMLDTGFKPPFTAAPTESSPETVVVPREPTQEMLDAMHAAFTGGYRNGLLPDAYRAMLAASQKS